MAIAAAYGTRKAVEERLAGESIQIAIRQPSPRRGRECHDERPAPAIKNRTARQGDAVGGVRGRGVSACRNVGIVESAAYSIYWTLLLKAIVAAPLSRPEMRLENEVARRAMIDMVD